MFVVAGSLSFQMSCQGIYTVYDYNDVQSLYIHTVIYFVTVAGQNNVICSECSVLYADSC